MNFLEFIIKTFGPKKIYSNPQTFKKALKNKYKEKKYKLPKLIYKSKVQKEIINSSDIYHFYNNKNDSIIIYLHGGAYVEDVGLYHLVFIDKLSKETNCDIYLPIYPLAPNHTYEETYDLLLNLYKKLLIKNKKIIIMGDSAGAGLTLSFTQYLKKEKIDLPTKLILISPWVDISMSNKELKKYERLDPMLSIYGLVESGKIWASNLDLKDYKVSPIYGDLENLPNTLIFTGSKELFYPDICLLNQKLKENNTKSELIVGENMYHVYPLYPIPKVKPYYKKIVDFIKE